MVWWITFKIGFQNLLLHKLRSFLTVLGMILGVGSVIAMLAIGEGSKRQAIEQIRKLGAGNVIIRSVKPKAEDDDSGESNSASTQQISRVLEYGLLNKDFDILTSALPNISKAVPIAMVRQNAQRGKRRISNARILGTTPDYLSVKNLRLRRGRFLTDVDNYTTANVVVLSAGAARALYSFEDPLDTTVLLGSGAYRVIGVLDTQDSGSARPGAGSNVNMNNDLYIPINSARSRFGDLQMIVRAGGLDFEKCELSEITLSLEDEEQVSQTAAMARRLLERTHPGKHDFEVQVPLELLQQAEHEKRIWNLVLGSIAGISLVVGGIGIMNIMLATVTERTREIGIRRALGAKRRDIIRQFLVESTLLSSVGGVFGIVLGIALPLIISHLAGIEVAFDPMAVLLAFSISAGVGILFGIYPARRAATMNPIEALRHQ